MLWINELDFRLQEFYEPLILIEIPKDPKLKYLQHSVTLFTNLKNRFTATINSPGWQLHWKNNEPDSSWCGKRSRR